MRLLFGILALAASLTAANASDWYASIGGGANWDDVIAHPAVQDNTGVVISGAVGRSVAAVPGLSFEAELAYRQNEVNITVGPGITVEHDTVALMANAIYDIPVELGPFHPYAKAGVGWSRTEATFENISVIKLESSGLAYQLGAGVNINLVEDGSVKFGVGYNFFQGSDISVFGTELSDGTNHSVEARMTFAL